MCIIKLGDYVEALIHVLTLGFGKRLSTWIAVDILGYQSCGCEERRIWLNKLTCKNYKDGIQI
mgnify:FL=1|tara:strand:+ start:126 stop:314 length:189 start_codon:yes stop_codon:yes gene_type:complete